MKIPRLCFLAILVVVTTCHSSTEHQLNRIDALLNNHPDSALSMLARIDTSRLARINERAYYNLLYTAALDKNYIDITDESRINHSAEYYADHGNLYDRMRSYYYQGIIRKNARNYSAAIVSFEKAEKEASSLQDLRFIGLAHRNMGNVFNATNNFIEARKHFKRAIAVFLDNMDSTYAEYATYSLAVSYLNNGMGFLENNDLDSCRYYLKQILNNSNDNSLLAYSNTLYAGSLIKNKDSLQRAINLFRLSPKSIMDYRDYAYYAYAFAKTGQLDSAKTKMETAFRLTHSKSEKAALNSILFRIDTLEGHYKDALYKVTEAMAVQDSVTRVLLQQSLSVSQKNYYQQENAIQEDRIQKQRLVYATTSITILLTSLLCLLIIIYRKRDKEAQIKDQMARLAVLEQEIRKGYSTLVGELFMGKIGQLCGLSNQYYTARNEQQKKEFSSQFKKASKDLSETPEFFDELENNLDLYCSGIMSKLNNQVPGIKGNNRKIIALFFAGIPDDVVQMLMKRVSVGSLRTLRSRFRHTIKEAHAPDETLFLDMLETEKQPGRKQKNKLP